MVAKAFFLFCSSALLVQTISAQCLGNIGNYGCNNGLIGAEIASAQLGGYGGCGNYGYNNGLIGAEIASAQLGGYGGCGCGIGSYAPSIASSGGGLTVSSASPISPSGLSVVSQNAIEGILNVEGQLPLLAAVAFESAVPSAGSAGASYSCGNGNVGITSDSLGAAGLGAVEYGLGNTGLYNGGIGNAGLYNAGLYNAGLYNAGLYNAGLYNAGLYNAGCGIAGIGAGLGSGCGCGGIYY